jgi:hypothetical protein
MVNSVEEWRVANLIALKQYNMSVSAIYVRSLWKRGIHDSVCGVSTSAVEHWEDLVS